MSPSRAGAHCASCLPEYHGEMSRPYVYITREDRQERSLPLRQRKKVQAMLPGDGSRLVLGWRGARTLHVVVAENTVDNEWIVITAYEPDPAQWETDFKRRKA